MPTPMRATAMVTGPVAKPDRVVNTLQNRQPMAMIATRDTRSAARAMGMLIVVNSTANAGPINRPI